MDASAVEVLRDRKIDVPESANSRLKAIRQVFKFGASPKKRYAPFNPTRDVEYFKTGSTGFHTWTPDEVKQFEQRHPIGTKPRLALALMVYSGQRRSDIIRFGKQHVKGGKISFTRFKGPQPETEAPNPAAVASIAAGHRRFALRRYDLSGERIRSSVHGRGIRQVVP
jgi:integrase